MTGSILQMFNHGTSTSMMFLLVGVIYDRAHHRDVNKFGGLAAQLPVYAGLFTVALFASMGLPGLSGFISEILVFLGAFNSNLGARDLGGGLSSMINISFASMTIISAFGVVLTAGYLLWMMQRVFFGPLNEKYKGYADVTGREMFTLIPLVIVVIALGVYPKPLIDLTQTSVQVVQKHVLKANEIEFAERHVGEVPAQAAAIPAPAGHSNEHASTPTPAAVKENTETVAARPVQAAIPAAAAEGAR
jgi:NADH-quinone oxidoreductase subunit M